MAARNLIGERVRLARSRTKPLMTQEVLAARLQIQGLQIDRAAISKIETGYRVVTDLESAAIARTLGVTVAWLFDGAQNSQKDASAFPTKTAIRSPEGEAAS